MNSKFVLIKILFFLILMPISAYSQNIEKLSDDILKINKAIAYVSALKTFCDTAAPNSIPANLTAFEAWKAANTTGEWAILNEKMTLKMPGAVAIIEKLPEQMLANIKKSMTGREETQCNQYPEFLKEPSVQISQIYKKQINSMISVLDGNPLSGKDDVKNDSNILKLEAGHYVCTDYTTRTPRGEVEAKRRGVDSAIPENSSKLSGTIDLYDNGTYSFSDVVTLKLPAGLSQWPETMGHYNTFYNTDVDLNQINWVSGKYTQFSGKFKKKYDIFDDRPTYYKMSKDNQIVIILKTEVRSAWYYTTECIKNGANSRKRPDLMIQASENQELYLQPDTIRSVQPPEGSGGLDGVYVSFDRRLYLTKSGFYSTGWRWGFDQLDCTRVVIPGGPLDSQRCSTYKIENNMFIVQGKEPERFQQLPGGELLVGDRKYTLVPPMQNLRLDGQYSYSYASSGAGFYGGGRHFLNLSKDGRFSFSSESFLSSTGINSNLAVVNDQKQDPESSGTYTLNGYSITLRYTSGIELRYSFLPEPNGKSFILLSIRYEINKGE